MNTAMGGEAGPGRMEAALDVVSAEARADGAFLDDFDRRRERTPARNNSDSSLASLTLSRPSIWEAFAKLVYG